MIQSGHTIPQPRIIATFKALGKQKINAWRAETKESSSGSTLSEIHDILACRGEDSGKTELEMGLLPQQISAQMERPC